LPCKNKLLAMTFLFLFSLPTTAIAATETNQSICDLLKADTVASADYQAGIDAYGNEVVPADLGDTPANIIPQEIKVPLTANLAHYLNENLASRLGDLNAPLGTLTIKGRDVYLNDTKLTEEQEEKLKEFCE